MPFDFPVQQSETMARLSQPVLMDLNPLVAARFELMKFTPARRIIEAALESGELQPGSQVMESSSGTFALALSIVCCHYGLNLTLVTGPVSSVVRWRLENLGARLHIVPASNQCEGGIQAARLEVLHDLLAKNPTAFWPQQYTNPLNGQSYQPIAEEILAEYPDIDTIVGSVGSGGSLFGMARVIKRKQPNLKVVGVDHNRSVIFGAEPKRITKMCRETFEQILAMGAGIPMGNVDFELLDEIHWMPVPLMIQEAHDFHHSTGNLVGPSSGAALKVARWQSEFRDGRVLVILPDHGMRYTDTMYNETWLDQWPNDMARQQATPLHIDNPRAVTEHWCNYSWKNQAFFNVLGEPTRPRHANFNP